MIKTANKKRSKVLLILSFAVVILFLGSVAFSGCSKTQEASGKKFDGQELILSGSTTLLQVSEAWASASEERS